MSGRGSVESLSFASKGSSRAPHRRGPSSGQLSSRSRQPGSRSGDSQSVHSQRQGRGRTADEDYHEFETSSESRGSYSHGSSSQGSGRDDRRRRPAERSRHVATLPARRPKEEQRQRQRQPRSAQRNPYTQSLRRPNGGRKRGGGDQERRAQSARDLTSTGSRRGRKGKPPSQPRPPPGKAWATIERRANPTVPPADPRTILAEAELHNLPAETMAYVGGAAAALGLWALAPVIVVLTVAVSSFEAHRDTEPRFPPTVTPPLPPHPTPLAVRRERGGVISATDGEKRRPSS